MVPRKQRSARNGGASNALAPKSARVTKDAAITMASRRSKRFAQQQPRNGLLDLQRTPEHLIAIAKRNSMESPLLRLPAELRNTIWELAMGGEYLEVPYYWRFGTPKNKSRNISRIQRDREARKKLAVIRLPSVSRQIYSETATLPYSANIFVVNQYFDKAHRVWSKSLLPAYRNAISVVALPNLSHEMVSDRSWSYNMRRKLLRTHVPELKMVNIADATVGAIKHSFWATEDRDGEMTTEDLNSWVTARVKKQQGKDLLVNILVGDEADDFKQHSWWLRH